MKKYTDKKSSWKILKNKIVLYCHKQSPWGCKSSGSDADGQEDSKTSQKPCFFMKNQCVSLVFRVRTYSEQPTRLLRYSRADRRDGFTKHQFYRGVVASHLSQSGAGGIYSDIQEVWWHLF